MGEILLQKGKLVWLGSARERCKILITLQRGNSTFGGHGLFPCSMLEEESHTSASLPINRASMKAALFSKGIHFFFFFALGSLDLLC